MFRVSYTSALLNTERFYKVATLGTSEPITFQSVTLGGFSDKPWAPANVRGLRNPSGDLTVSWAPRTRAGGDLGWGTIAESPQVDTPEGFEIDIIDAGVAVSSLTGITSRSRTITVAELESALGTGYVPGGSVTVDVYQMSINVGRGVPTRATL